MYSVARPDSVSLRDRRIASIRDYRIKRHGRVSALSQ